MADLPTVPALNRRAVSGNPQKGSPLRRGAGTARRRRLVHGPFLQVGLDANVVLGAVASRGVGEAIVELYRERHPTLTGAEILSEVSRKLRLPQATAMSYHCRLAVNLLKGSTHAAVIANRLPQACSIELPQGARIVHVTGVEATSIRTRSWPAAWRVSSSTESKRHRTTQKFASPVSSPAAGADEAAGNDASGSPGAWAAV